jgi:hypothetical protein
MVVQQKKEKSLTTKLQDGCLLIDFVVALGHEI